MCGIVGVVSRHNKHAGNRILNSLKRLEYRGYDSAGIAVLNDNNSDIDVYKTVGEIKNLENLLSNHTIVASTGIGHTRWATHGKASNENAHPHSTEVLSLVHNGIIENYESIKERLINDHGVSFKSNTDSEVIARLITIYYSSGKSKGDPLEAVKMALKELSGAYAIAVLFKGLADKIIVARKGSPLVIGLGDGENYIGSDAAALSEFSDKITYLEDGDIAEISSEEVIIYDASGNRVQRDARKVDLGDITSGKGEFPHFMLKEIYEQPEVCRRTLGQYVDFDNYEIKIDKDFLKDLSSIEKLTIVSCGTSYYASFVAKYWFEQIARVSVEIDVASEFRYRTPPLSKNGMSMFISQSGETADTLAALRYVKEQGQKVIGLVNVKESSIDRESDLTLYTYAGPEIGVASTKAFMAQITVLKILMIALAKEKGLLSEVEFRKTIDQLHSLPGLIEKTLEISEPLKKISADYLKDKNSILYIGRGSMVPIAYEGALKIKELSYIHAEGIGAGELKHGPIALIDENTPVVALSPSCILYDKMLSNIEEIISRNGKVIQFMDFDSDANVGSIREENDGLLIKVNMPKVDPAIAPFIYTIPMQLLAYHTSLLMGRNIDKPRNLAKSVTVE